MQKDSSHTKYFSDHGKIKLEINYRMMSVKFPNTWKLNNTHLNIIWPKKSKGKLQNIWNEWKHTVSKSVEGT